MSYSRCPVAPDRAAGLHRKGSVAASRRPPWDAHMTDAFCLQTLRSREALQKTDTSAAPCILKPEIASSEQTGGGLLNMCQRFTSRHGLRWKTAGENLVRPRKRRCHLCIADSTSLATSSRVRRSMCMKGLHRVCSTSGSLPQLRNCRSQTEQTIAAHCTERLAEVYLDKVRAL